MDVRDVKLWTALVTPFDENLNVDYDSLANLLREQEEAGNGLLILGSTGEGLNIGDTTKKDIIQFVQKQNLKVPIMAGVGGHDYAATKSWVQWLETQNVEAYLMVAPIYAKPGAEGQTEWFKGLMNEVSKPVMLYNVPGRTAKELELQTVRKLVTHQNFWAIKEASGSVDKFKLYLEASNNAMVYCGDDGLMPDFAKAGSSGLVSVASNAWPKPTKLYVQQCIDERLDDKQLWTRAADSLFVASNPVPVKRLLKNEGRIKSDNLMPPLSQKDLKNDRNLTESSEIVKQWYQQQTSK